MKATKALRKRLDNWKQQPIIAPGTHDPFCARIAEKLGFNALYMSGAYTSLSKIGMADFGLATATEMLANAMSITSITDLPLIADADNGYGNALNTIRTVQDYIRAGVAGIHIEDQVIPKRCGHIKGKMVIPLEEMVGKIRAAKKVIREEDDDFVLIARSDAKGAAGGGLDDVIKRLKECHRAGADLVFPDGLQSKEEFAAVSKGTGAPTVFNPSGITPRLSVDECRELGVGLMIYPLASFHAMAVAVWNFLEQLKEEGTLAQIKFENQNLKHPLGDLRKLFDLGGLEEFQELEREFLPTQEVLARYDKSVGI